METKLCGWQPRCLDQFEASRQDFQTYSLFPFKIVPGEPIPSAILKFFEMEHDPYVIQLRKYMDWAHQMLMACWSSNGRVWEVRLRWNASVILHGQLEEKLNEVHSTACAPQSCKMSQVIQQIAPRLFFTNHQVYTGFTGTAKALSSWKFVNVQFAIVGTGGCGTTSLRKNLEQHPGVRFTYEGDDVLYAPGYNHLYQGGFRMLPTEEQVNQLKCGKGRCRAEDVDDRIIGLKNYNLYNFDVGLAALSLKRMKIILLVCDPLDRLEKALYYKHCQFTSRCENRSVIDEIVAGKDVAELVAEHREYWIASERIMFLMSLFKPPDVIIAHQEVLRTSPDFLYQTLFKQIGAGPFQMRFHRYNSVGGLRSGLCQRRKLLKEFQQALEPEYAKLEHLLTAIGHPKVKELSLRHSRCHRRNELRSTRRCVNQRCE